MRVGEIGVIIKTVAESAITNYPVRIFPGDLNAHGTIFGGKILETMDWVAGYVACKHSNAQCVTLSVDSVEFLAPARQGDVLIFKATVNRVWGKSMEVGVKVMSENLFSQEVRHVNSAYFTFVAVDENHKPTEILVGLQSETADEIRRYEAAEIRRQHRLANKK